MLVLFFALLASIITTSYFGPGVRPGGKRGVKLYRECRSQVRDISIAMEMYSQDWGTYPQTSQIESGCLTPKYLLETPSCPSAGEKTYTVEVGPGSTYNTRSYQDYYFIKCAGRHHFEAGFPADHPQRNSIKGWISPEDRHATFDTSSF